MKDLYKRLSLDESADERQVRAALAEALKADRLAAEQVLLDPRRRAVYDRNRQLLLSISQLRGHLGLNYTRFWARREFKDFWQDLTPLQPGETARSGRRVDAQMIARAIHVVGVHGRRRAARWGPWAWVGGLAALIAALAVFVAKTHH